MERFNGTNARRPVSAKGMGRGGSLNLMGSKTMRMGWRWVAIAGFAAGMAVGQSIVTAPAKPSATVVEPPAPLLPTNGSLIADDTKAAVPADKHETAAILAEDGLKRLEHMRRIPTSGRAGILSIAPSKVHRSIRCRTESWSSSAA
jgi:hypothetical protein